MSEWHRPVELAGPTLRLRQLLPADAEDVLAALGDDDSAAEVFAHLRLHPPRDRAAAEKMITDGLAEADRIAYGQWLTATGELVGSTSFYEISPATRSIANGHTWVARRFWRTHVNTESKLVMLGRAFDGLGAERVVWHTDIRNLRSQAAIERLGATREGVLRHHRVRRDGSWRDTVQYSMLRQEWPAVRRRLAERLNRSG